MAPLQLVDKAEEFEVLKRIVIGLEKSAGRETAGDSYELDYCWDLLEEYNEAYDAGLLPSSFT